MRETLGTRRATEPTTKATENKQKKKIKYVNHSPIYVEQLETMVNKEKDYRKERNVANGKI